MISILDDWIKSGMIDQPSDSRVAQELGVTTVPDTADIYHTEPGDAPTA